MCLGLMPVSYRFPSLILPVTRLYVLLRLQANNEENTLYVCVCCVCDLPVRNIYKNITYLIHGLINENNVWNYVFITIWHPWVKGQYLSIRIVLCVLYFRRDFRENTTTLLYRSGTSVIIFNHNCCSVRNDSHQCLPHLTHDHHHSKDVCQHQVNGDINGI